MNWEQLLLVNIRLLKALWEMELYLKKKLEMYKSHKFH